MDPHSTDPGNVLDLFAVLKSGVHSRFVADLGWFVNGRIRPLLMLLALLNGDKPDSFVEMT